VHVVAIQHSTNKENRVASSSFSAVDWRAAVVVT
jgi:hypothetical protein